MLTGSYGQPALTSALCRHSDSSTPAGGGSETEEADWSKGAKSAFCGDFLAYAVEGGLYLRGRLVKGSVARVVAAQKLRFVPSKSLGSVIAGYRSRRQFGSAVQMRKS